MFDVVTRLSTQPVPGTVASSLADRAMAALEADAAVAPPKPEAPVESKLTVPLSALFEFWPEAIRLEIAQARWDQSSIAFPLNRLEAALRTGQVVFTWGQIIRWLVPTASGSSPHLETSLELPLRVLVPLFMGQRPAPASPQKVVVGENIPNLFAAPKPADAAAAPFAPASGAIPRAPAASLTPANVLGDLFGQPEKWEWQPQDITQQINAMPGVAASLIVKNDGLLVAGALPPHLKSDAMATLLPQVFGRVSQHTGNVQLGPLTAMTLFTGQSRCAIFKTGSLYLVVLSKPAAALPDVILQRIAAEMTKRNR